MGPVSISPPPHGLEWPVVMADEAGMNWIWLEEAARFASENEAPWPYDLRRHLEGGFFEPAPFNEILGPIRPRGHPMGLSSDQGRGSSVGAIRRRSISRSRPRKAI